MASNQWGPYYPQAQFEYGGQPNVPATPPQSPSGSVTGESAEYNYVNEITSTQNVLENVLYVDVVEPATDALTTPVSLAGLPAAAISQNSWTASAVAPVQE